LSSIEASGSRSVVTLKAILPDATAAENLNNEINKFPQFLARIDKLAPIKDGGVGADYRIELRKP
jgi:hypothetical protein